jgi:hypothetical protein
MFRLTFLVALVGLACVALAQEQKISEIDDQVVRIDLEIKGSAFKEASFEDDYGNETDIKAYFKESELLKMEATSRSLKGKVVKSFYFYNAELIMVDEVRVEHPGLANWEEAKSSDLGDEEIRRVQTTETIEKRFYLDDWEVIKAEPGAEKLREGLGEKLNREAQELFRRLG